MISHISTIDMYEINEDDKKFTVRKVSSWQSGEEEWTVMFGGEKLSPGEDAFKKAVKMIQKHLE